MPTQATYPHAWAQFIDTALLQAASNSKNRIFLEKSEKLQLFMNSTYPRK